MLFTKSVFSTGLLLGLAFLTASQSSASTLSYSQAVSPQVTTYPGTTVVSFPRFDPTLGTLTSVQIGGLVNTTTTLAVFSTNPSSENFTSAASSNNVTFSYTLDPGLSSTVVGAAGPYSGVASTGLNSYPPIFGSAALPSSSVVVTAVNLNNYILTGGLTTVGLSYSTGPITYTGSPTIPGTLFFGGTSSSGGSLSLTYIYTAAVSSAPLPAVAPAGLALIGVVGVIKLRRKRQIAATV